MYCLLFTVHGSKISRMGRRPCALRIKFLTSLFSHNNSSCVVLAVQPGLTQQQTYQVF